MSVEYAKGMLAITPSGEMLPYDPHDCTVGVQTADDGRVWVCVDGQALVRFKPHRPSEPARRPIPPFPKHIEGRVEWVERAIAERLQEHGRTISDEERRALGVFVHLGQPYNLPLIGDWRETRYSHEGALVPPIEALAGDGMSEFERLAPIELRGSFIVARLRSQLATYDMSDLTSLVLAAHKYAVRVSIHAEAYECVDTGSFIDEWNPVERRYEATDEHPRGVNACLTLMLHPRQPNGPGMHLYERHPSIAEAIEERE